jgi:hypothetical protein
MAHPIYHVYIITAYLSDLVMHSIASVKATMVAPNSQSLTTVKPIRLTELYKKNGSRKVRQKLYFLVERGCIFFWGGGATLLCAGYITHQC